MQEPSHTKESLRQEQELWRQIGVLTRQGLLEQRCALLRQTRSYKYNRPATKQELKLVLKAATSKDGEVRVCQSL